MKNSIFIRKNYKLSTIPRLLDVEPISKVPYYGFKSIRDINKSDFLTYLLETSTSSYVQDELLNRLLDEKEKKEYEQVVIEEKHLASLETDEEIVDYIGGLFSQ